MLEIVVPNVVLFSLYANVRNVRNVRNVIFTHCTYTLQHSPRSEASVVYYHIRYGMLIDIQFVVTT